MRLKIPGLDSEERVKTTINGILNGQFRNCRYALHKYYETFETDAIARQNRPEKVTEDQWITLCDYWWKENVKACLSCLS